MNLENLIPIPQLCSHYELDMSFFVNLSEIGLLQITTVETTSYIDLDSIQKREKMIHLHQDLEVNIEGIDVVFNLLQKMDSLQNEVIALKNRLRLHES